MLNIDPLISRLEALSEPSRNIDGHIAGLLGFKRRTVQEADPRTGETKVREVWALPTGEAPAIVPSYTANLDAAFELIRTVAPEAAFGCTWHRGFGRASILGSVSVQAATPAIALCIAALKHVQSRQSNA
ncbi:hypothetical protein [Sinorhizobium meliloti]|uniref:hypothetical protein n=1 Tax=Rhizobium meliloti TaxID=382 RepID=UPI001146BEE7|nr:hypothetical protein [Sinorhizobium meliloti]